MTYAETLSEKERKNGRKYAYLSTFTGCVSEVLLDHSAVVIIFFTMLDGGEMLAMMGTSFTGIAGALLYLPSSMLIIHTGLKPMVLYSCLAGTGGFLLMATAPFFGMAAAKYVALAGCLLYCVSRITYGATWYPLLDVFLRPEDRAGFFSKMRLMYTGFNGVLLFGIGFVMLHNPSITVLQIVIAIAGIVYMGRYFCIARFPDNKRDVLDIPDIRKGLSISVKNGPLTSYAVYNGLLMLSYSALAPLAYVYMKQYVLLAPGTVQIISSAGMGGLIFGYFCYGKIFADTKLKYMELAAHLLFMISAFVLFGVDGSTPGFAWIAGGVIFALSMGYSMYMCNNSAELLALARPGNKTMATAFVQTYSSAGAAISRLGVSLIFGTAMLSPEWLLGSRSISCYQTLFLLFGVMSMILLLLLPTLPSFVPDHEDYYEPKK